MLMIRDACMCGIVMGAQLRHIFFGVSEEDVHEHTANGALLTGCCTVLLWILCTCAYRRV